MLPTCCPHAAPAINTCLCRGRLCLYGRRGVRDTDLNFPVESYSAGEVPSHIEDLQAYIKEGQVSVEEKKSLRG